MKVKSTLTIVLLSAFFLVACTTNKIKTTYNSSNANEVHIGLVYPVEMLDKEIQLSKGIDLAIKNVNKSGGVLGKTLKVLVRDDNGDTNLAMQIAQTFCEQDIYAVIGHWSTDVSFFVEDIYEKNKVIMMTPMASGMNLLEDSFNYIFRMSANNEVYADALSQHLINEGLASPVIYYTDDEYGNDFAQIIEKSLFNNGIRVVDRVNSISNNSFERINKRWKALGCDSIILATSYPDYIEPIKIILENTPYPIFGADTFEEISLNDLITTDRIFKTYISAETLDPIFLNEFYAEYNHAPNLAAIYGYQAVILLADAMNSKQDIKGPAIAEYLSSLQDYQSIFGKISYNKESGEFERFNVKVQPLYEGD